MLMNYHIGRLVLSSLCVGAFVAAGIWWCSFCRLQPGTPLLPPYMYPCLSDTTVLDRATGHVGHLVKEAVESPGEHENPEHIKLGMLSCV